jgi:hypothetical protein
VDDNTITSGGRRTRCAMHTKKIKTVELFVFGSTPFRPGAKLAKFAPGVFSDLAFFGGSSVGLDEVNEEVNFINGKVIDIGVINKDRVDGSEILGSNFQIIIGIDIGDSIVIKGAFEGGGVTILFCWKRLGSKGDAEFLESSRCAEPAKDCKSIVLSEDRLIINSGDKGAGEAATSGGRSATDAESATAVRDLRNVDSGR